MAINAFTKFQPLDLVFNPVQGEGVRTFPRMNTPLSPALRPSPIGSGCRGAKVAVGTVVTVRPPVLRPGDPVPSCSVLVVALRTRPGLVGADAVPLAENRPEIRVTGRVARHDRVQSNLATQAAGGLAIETVQVGALGRLIGDLRLTQNEP